MRKILLTGGAVLVAALILLRLLLPSLVLRRVNEALARLDRHEGRVEKVGLSFLSGRITVRGVDVRQKGTGLRIEVPVVTATFSYGALLRRRLVADVAADRAILHLVAHKPVKGRKRRVGQALDKMLHDFGALRVERFRLSDGTVLISPEDDPKTVMLRVEDLDVAVDGLHDSERLKGTLNAAVADGTFTVALSGDPRSEKPAFTVTAEAAGWRVSKLGAWLHWRWKTDVERGVFDMRAEAEAADGGYAGTVIPEFDRVESSPAKGAGIVGRVKQAVVKAVIKRNEARAEPEKVRFDGKFDNPDTGFFEAATFVVRKSLAAAVKPKFSRL